MMTMNSRKANMFSRCWFRCSKLVESWTSSNLFTLDFCFAIASANLCFIKQISALRWLIKSLPAITDFFTDFFPNPLDGYESSTLRLYETSVFFAKGSKFTRIVMTQWVCLIWWTCDSRSIIITFVSAFYQPLGDLCLGATTISATTISATTITNNESDRW